MKKILIFFILALSSIIFLAGCQDILSISNDFISDIDTGSLIPADSMTESESTFEQPEEEDDIIESDSENENLIETDTSYTVEADTIDNDIETNNETDSAVTIVDEITVNEESEYTDKESVALYIHTFGKLPGNYITKKQAQEMGWNNKENTIAEILPGKSIGGDHFGNYEGILPKEKGRTYKECDIDYETGGRNAKRIVYSNDGLIFYTDDHYNTFEQLY